MDNGETNESWRTIGQDRAVKALSRALISDRLSHAYLLEGPRHVGKMTLALDLARAVNCIGEERPCGGCAQCRRIEDGLHADVLVVGVASRGDDSGRSRVAITIDQVREVQRVAGLKPYEGRYRVFIIDGAERLSEEAANSLLKVLEEPPEQVILVLLAQDATGLLPTIVSRCNKIELRRLPASQVARELEARYDIEPERSNQIARLSGGLIGWALQAASQPDLLERRETRLAQIEAVVQADLEERFSYAASMAVQFGQDRELARQHLELWLGWWRDILVIKEGQPDLVVDVGRLDTLRDAAQTLSSAHVAAAVRSLLTASEYLDRNVSPRLVLEDLMLALPRP